MRLDGQVPVVTMINVATAAIGTTDFTPVDIPSTLDCKSILMKPRLVTTKWYLSSEASPGTAYITFEAGTAYTVDISKGGSTRVCFVKGGAVDILEMSLARS